MGPLPRTFAGSCRCSERASGTVHAGVPAPRSRVGRASTENTAVTATATRPAVARPRLGRTFGDQAGQVRTSASTSTSHTKTLIGHSEWR